MCLTSAGMPKWIVAGRNLHRRVALCRVCDPQHFIPNVLAENVSDFNSVYEQQLQQRSFCKISEQDFSDKSCALAKIPPGPGPGVGCTSVLKLFIKLFKHIRQAAGQQRSSNQIHVTFLFFHRTQDLSHVLTRSVPPFSQQPPVVVRRYRPWHHHVKIRFAGVGIYVWWGKGQSKRRDSVVLMTRLTLCGGRQCHHESFTWDQRPFVTDSMRHAPPLVSEVSFRWPIQTVECEAQHLATSF